MMILGQKHDPSLHITKYDRHLFRVLQKYMPIPVAAGSKAWACGRWDRGFESHQNRGCLSLVFVVSCQVEVFDSANYSSREVLTNEVCPSVNVKLRL